MAVKVGINGFGRIGRVIFRIMHARGGFEVVGINDLTDAKTLAHLLKYDSTHGRFQGTVAARDGAIEVDGRAIKVTSERDPANLPWGDLGADVVIESTGVFRSRDKIELHIKAGARKVLLTVPSKAASDVDATVVLGVNDADLTAGAKIVSNASCTTNCLAPIAKAVNDAVGIEQGLMTTIHSYTNDQSILDLPHSDLRRARSAAINIIPSSTGAAKAIGLVVPELNGLMNGFAVRVPTWDGSLVDLVCTLKRDSSVQEINQVIKAAAEGPMKGVLEYTEDEIVSTDIIGNPHSSVFDAKSTMMIGKRMVKLVSWYDNEYGYSSRCADLIARMARD